MAGDRPLYRLPPGTRAYEARFQVVWREIHEKEAAARQRLLETAGISPEEFERFQRQGYRLGEMTDAAAIAQGDSQLFRETLKKITGGDPDHPLPMEGDIFPKEF